MTPEREREIRERTADLLAGATTPVRPAGVDQLGRDLADLLAYVDQLRSEVKRLQSALRILSQGHHAVCRCRSCAALSTSPSEAQTPPEGLVPRCPETCHHGQCMKRTGHEEHHMTRIERPKPPDGHYWAWI